MNSRLFVLLATLSIVRTIAGIPLVEGVAGTRKPELNADTDNPTPADEAVAVIPRPTPKIVTDNPWQKDVQWSHLLGEEDGEQMFMKNFHDHTDYSVLIERTLDTKNWYFDVYSKVYSDYEYPHQLAKPLNMLHFDLDEKMMELLWVRNELVKSGNTDQAPLSLPQVITHCYKLAKEGVNKAPRITKIVPRITKVVLRYSLPETIRNPMDEAINECRQLLFDALPTREKEDNTVNNPELFRHFTLRASSNKQYKQRCLNKILEAPVSRSILASMKLIPQHWNKEIVGVQVKYSLNQANNRVITYFFTQDPGDESWFKWAQRWLTWVYNKALSFTGSTRPGSPRPGSPWSGSLWSETSQLESSRPESPRPESLRPESTRLE